MNKLTILILLISLNGLTHAGENKTEKPIQHIKLADITNLAEAEKVFLEKTTVLKKIKQFDQAKLEEIHLTTYSLEKSMDYYVKHLKGKNKSVALALANEIKQIHINSENNRPAKTKRHLKNYFKLAQMLPLTH